MGRAELIGNGKKHLIPSFQPAGTGKLPQRTRGLPSKSRACADAPGPLHRRNPEANQNTRAGRSPFLGIRIESALRVIETVDTRTGMLLAECLLWESILVRGTLKVSVDPDRPLSFLRTCRLKPPSACSVTSSCDSISGIRSRANIDRPTFTTRFSIERGPQNRLTENFTYHLSAVGYCIYAIAGLIQSLPSRGFDVGHTLTTLYLWESYTPLARVLVIRYPNISTLMIAWVYHFQARSHA